jgi:hypothetical protein
MAARAKVLVAAESFVCEVAGEQVLVQAGVTRVLSTDALVKGRAHLFEPAEPETRSKT